MQPSPTPARMCGCGPKLCGVRRIDGMPTGGVPRARCEDGEHWDVARRSIRVLRVARGCPPCGRQWVGFMVCGMALAPHVVRAHPVLWLYHSRSMLAR